MKVSLPLMVLVTVITLSTPVFSQSGETKVEFQKGDKISAIIELPYTARVVEDAIQEYMEKKGGKSDRVKSFDVYRNSRLDKDEPEIVDVYYRVDRKVTKDKEAATVYLLIGRPGENVGARAEDDHFKIAESKELLNKMAPFIDAYNLDVQIKLQEDVVKKSEKKLLSLKDDQSDLEKKIKSLQDKLAQNKNDQQLQTDDLNRQKEALNLIQNKKDTSNQGKLSKQ
ncbi:hypothetical protein A4H97_06235 [Niastella yeongjuensis]|uniref:DUF4831 domain-containing protein n=1 Tax=Niastella yeongjuensis TaxID=354355 RepID=A0A1V9ELU2_9BACT|nr:hypothetical protein [Niastella yeongjuensis]OQP47107.1 hypothetical protein A4H97_06235 [Niastella yeongjuensis]SEN70171.1 hypothetical protein SAMN05660816_01274 [Niastella yeongjuensis]